MHGAERADRRKYGIIREYGGHGIGRAMHMEPFLPNYGKPGKGPRLRVGMAIAIEPMLTLGGERTEELEDGWTVVTVGRLPRRPLGTHGRHHRRRPLGPHRPLAGGVRGQNRPCAGARSQAATLVAGRPVPDHRDRRLLSSGAGCARGRHRLPRDRGGARGRRGAPARAAARPGVTPGHRARGGARGLVVSRWQPGTVPVAVAVALTGPPMLYLALTPGRSRRACGRGCVVAVGRGGRRDLRVGAGLVPPAA